MDTRNNPPEHLPSSESEWVNTNDYGYAHPDVSETNPLDKLRAKLARPKPPKTVPLEMSASMDRNRHRPKRELVTLVITNSHGCRPINMSRGFPLEEPFAYSCWCGKRMYWELPEFYTEVKAGYTITADGVLFSTWAAMQTSS